MAQVGGAGGTMHRRSPRRAVEKIGRGGAAGLNGAVGSCAVRQWGVQQQGERMPFQWGERRNWVRSLYKGGWGSESMAGGQSGIQQGSQRSSEQQRMGQAGHGWLLCRETTGWLACSRAGAGNA